MIRRYTILITMLCCFSALCLADNVRTTLTLSDALVTSGSYTDKEIVMNSKTELHITNKSAIASDLLNNSIIQLNSENSWVIFDNVRPQFVIDSLLRYIYINNQSAVLKTNVRVSFYKHGTVVIPQSTSYQPLKVYTGQNFTGDSASYSLYVYNNSLGSLDNKVRSFKLKRGYMATLATSADGLGYSRVYIADDADLEVSVMPSLLDQSVSFIRVFSWEYVTKKGWCGTSSSQLNMLNTTWCYDWSAYAATTSQSEYVPMRAKLTWAPFSQINALTNVTHSLGFNEPDHAEQHQDDNGGKALTVSQALAQWPDMLKSGLRVGAPACTDFSWLYSFMDSCKAKNYRVDYVAIHAYWGGKTPANWYNDLKYIYQKTGRPLWITEWNNGANWTTETWPTTDRTLSTANAAKQLADIKAILNVLDTASFVERYSIYNWVQDCRAMVLGDTLTPAGKYYASDNSAMAFNRKKEVIPAFIFKNPSLSLVVSSKKVTLSISDPNADCLRGFILEKKVNDGIWAEFYRSVNSTVKQYVDTFSAGQAGRVRYRVRTVLNDGTITGYSNETGYDVTGGYNLPSVGNFQYGSMKFANSCWNPIYFRQSYSASPAIVTGAPSDNNSGIFISPRVKLVNASTYFNGQIAPWAYQNVSTFPNEEEAPYFIVPTGVYNLGTLKMKAGRATVLTNWTPVVFSGAFDTIPVVFANQLLSNTTNATVVRVRNVTKTGFEAKIMKETANTTTITSETVTYVAVTPGSGTIDTKKVIVGTTADNYVGSTFRTLNYGDSISKPLYYSQMQTCNDDTVTACLRTLAVTNKFAIVFKQRERSTTATYMGTEKVGWMVMDTLVLTTSVDNVSMRGILIYPNPAREVVNISGDVSENEYVELYNMLGVLLKKQKLTSKSISLHGFVPGNYIVRISGTGLSAVLVKE